MKRKLAKKILREWLTNGIQAKGLMVEAVETILKPKEKKEPKKIGISNRQ